MKLISQVSFTIMRMYFAEAMLQPDCNAHVFSLETKVLKIYIPISIQRWDFSNGYYKYSFSLLTLELWIPGKLKHFALRFGFGKSSSLLAVQSLRGKKPKQQTSPKPPQKIIPSWKQVTSLYKYWAITMPKGTKLLCERCNAKTRMEKKNAKTKPQVIIRK